MYFYIAQKNRIVVKFLSENNKKIRVDSIRFDTIQL